MRFNESGKFKRTKYAGLFLKAAIFMALFAMLVFALSFAIFGDSLNSEASSVATAEETAEVNEVNGSSEADPAAKSGGGTTLINTTSGITLSGSSTEREVKGFKPLAGNMTTSTGSYYYTGNNDGSHSATGDTYTAVSGSGTSNRDMYVYFNFKFCNTELAYLLQNGGSLQVTIEATFTINSGNNHHGFGILAGKNSAPGTPTAANSSGSYAFYSKDLSSEGDKITFGSGGDRDAAVFTLSGWNSTTATSGTTDTGGAIGFYVAFRIYQEGVWTGRSINGTISATKMTVKAILPSDSAAPKNATASSSESSTNLTPYKTTLSNLPYHYGATTTGTENVYADFDKLKEALDASLDSGANTTNTEEVNLKSYRASSLGTIGGYSYYKKVVLNLTDTVMLNRITLSTSETEKIELCPYKQSSASACMKSTADNTPVYYYSYSKSSVKAATLTLYFYANTKLTVTTSDYASGSAAKTVVTVAGIDPTAASAINQVSLEADNEETPYATTTAKLADAPWIYTATQKIALTAEASTNSPYVYYYRLYYSTTADGTYSEITPGFSTLGSFKYAAGKVFAYQSASSLTLDFEALKAEYGTCYGSGFYKIRFAVANLTGTNSAGTYNSVYYFKVDYDNDANASTLRANLGNTGVAGEAGDFTPYLLDSKGVGEYWIGTKDMTSAAYPYIKLEIIIKNSTRSSALASIIGNNLSGNSLTYTNALGEESIVVVSGGALNAVDSVGGTVGTYVLPDGSSQNA